MGPADLLAETRGVLRDLLKRQAPLLLEVKGIGPKLGKEPNPSAGIEIGQLKVPSVPSRSAGSAPTWFEDMKAQTAESHGRSELSDKLARRAFMGLRVGAAQRGRPGVRVLGVLPGGPASRAGLQADDLVLSLQGVPAPDAAILRKEMAKVRPGQSVELAVARNEGLVSATLLAEERPLESYEDLDVFYDAVEHQGAKLRTILTSPRSAQRAPCVIYLQGYSAESVDCGRPGPNLLRELVAAFGRAGYAVLRVEKPGIGDSEGGPCEESGFLEETEALAAALPFAERCEQVDRRALVLFGHSMGGLQAAMIAGRSAAVRGVAVYGGVGSAGVDYEAENLKRQMTLAGSSTQAIEERLRQLQHFQTLLYRQRRPLGEILERHPAVAAQRDLYGIDSESTIRGRHPRYWQEVEQIPIAAHFAALDVPLLAAWGEADYRASREDHQRLAELVNRRHPGFGTYCTVAASDHGLARFPGQAESFKARGQGQFNPAVIATFSSWLNSLAP